ncbi:hypothetical protein FB554_0281 [Barrientosiimonas humi]|uniref:Uncharacterized protein n=1 Tax=Barrientosiimonas humi TaxID=999931 RepID=A0A542X8L0_9MICO|nr:hypothetical protein [Barrientosiimonas humi]TQL32165.1 hypothetical protein FB554_0281 [Barrientosiimonas humi]CAG7572153.1 hypothetical protein BH39T_PBIAJDOK_00763 [Barrientosiimonas humi]
MPKYLTDAEVRRAVERLGRSSARARICEFLIGVRTLRLAGKTEVAVAESVPEFIQALEEFTLWVSDADVDSPYFNPFGGQAAFKSPKFRSNGPSNTMHGWATQANSPFEILNTRPKSIKRRPLSATQLRAFVIQSRKDDDRPRLIDAAVWFYRQTDLEGDDGSTPDRAALEARFIEDLALTSDDVSALFRLEDEDTADDTIGDEPAEAPETPETLPVDSDAPESRSEPA